MNGTGTQHGKHAPESKMDSLCNSYLVTRDPLLRAPRRMRRFSIPETIGPFSPPLSLEHFSVE
jgi:hypothetical protein